MGGSGMESHGLGIWQRPLLGPQWSASRWLSATGPSFLPPCAAVLESAAAATPPACRPLTTTPPHNTHEWLVGLQTFGMNTGQATAASAAAPPASPHLSHAPTPRGEAAWGGQASVPGVGVFGIGRVRETCPATLGPSQMAHPWCDPRMGVQAPCGGGRHGASSIICWWRIIRRQQSGHGYAHSIQCLEARYCIGRMPRAKAGPPYYASAPHIQQAERELVFGAAALQRGTRGTQLRWRAPVR